VLPHELDELLALLLVAVIEPAASVHDVVLLEHPQAAPVGRGVGEDEYLPPLVGGVFDEDVLEPVDLPLVDGDLVTREYRLPEDGAPETDEQRLVGDLPAELGGLLPVAREDDVEILPVGLEFVEALEVVVPPHDLVRHAEAPEEFGRHLVALGRAREELGVALGVVAAVLGFAEVSEAHDGHALAVALGLREDVLEVALADGVIFHLARVDVEIAEDADYELVRAGGGGGGGVLLGGGGGGAEGGAGEGSAPPDGDGGGGGERPRRGGEEDDEYGRQSHGGGVVILFYIIIGLSSTSD
jgi:hypothetical protein